MSFSPVSRRALPLALTLIALPLAATMAAAAARPAAAVAPARVQSVTVKDFAFVPQVVTVAPGTTVTWTNADEDPHTVTANDHGFHSAAMDSGERFSYTFTRAGEFGYFCSLHPHMTGKVIVKG